MRGRNQVGRLIRAVDALNVSSLVADQVGKIKERLSRGVGLDGKAFSGFKNPDANHANSKPLQRASRLFDSPTFTFERGLASTEAKATITGQAAKIAYYQNKMRKFVGFSESDRAEARATLSQMLRSLFNQWH